MAGTFEKILVATDFSHEAALAAAHAARLARASKGRVSFVHVLPDISPELAELTGARYARQHQREREQEAKGALDELVAASGAAPLSPRCRVLRGRVGKTLEAHLRREKPTLLCMGAHGAGASRGRRIGTVAEYMGRHAPCSVLLARPPHVGRYETALLALELDPAGAAALSSARELATTEKMKLHLVHAFEFPSVGASVPGGLEEFEKHYSEVERKRVAGFLEAATASELFASIHVVEGGDVPAAIIAQLAKLDAQLLVLGTHRRGRLAHLFLGSTSAELARVAPVSVLVVRPLSAKPAGGRRRRAGS